MANKPSGTFFETQCTSVLERASLLCLCRSYKCRKNDCGRRWWRCWRISCTPSLCRQFRVHSTLARGSKSSGGLSSLVFCY